MTSDDMKQLADKIDLHLTLDRSPGYHLSDEDQRMIVAALRLAANVLKEAT